MKNIIVTVGEILLGVILFGLIFGTSGSLRSEANSILNDVVTEMTQMTTTIP